MSWQDAVIDGLQRGGIDLVAYLPDSVLGPVIEQIGGSGITTVRVAREEAAIGLLAGAWLGGRRGALVCQSSGLANCFNALGSLAVPGGLPFVGLVSRRGDLGDHNRAQVPAGYSMPRLLDEVGVRNRILDHTGDPSEVVDLAAETAFSVHDPYIVLLDRTLTGGKP
jgi:sulfopyruvate decarboxylase alpha subunit